MILRNFLDENVLFLQVAIILTCFQFEKSQNKLDLLQCFLLKHFTKLVKMNWTGQKAKSHTSVIFHSHFAWICTKALFYILSRLAASKLLRKALKFATKAYNNERTIRSDLKPEVDALLNNTCRKMRIACCITKLYQFNFFWFIGSNATRHWNRDP